MTRSSSLTALIALLVGVTALRWPPAAIFAGFLLGAAIVLAVLALRPAIEIHDTHILIGSGAGRRSIAWSQIRRIDQPRWLTLLRTHCHVLVVHLTLDGEGRLQLVHAGHLDSDRRLLRHLRHYAREALLDGIPYGQFWGQPKVSDGRHQRVDPGHARFERVSPNQAGPESLGLRDPGGSLPATDSPKRPLLLAEDEAEIEQMFQRLRSVGRLDTRGDAPFDPRATDRDDRG